MVAMFPDVLRFTIFRASLPGMLGVGMYTCSVRLIEPPSELSRLRQDDGEVGGDIQQKSPDVSQSIDMVGVSFSWGSEWESATPR